MRPPRTQLSEWLAAPAVLSLVTTLVAGIFIPTCDARRPVCDRHGHAHAPTGVERDRSSRRALLAHSLGALAAVTAPHHARAIVAGGFGEPPRRHGRPHRPRGLPGVPQGRATCTGTLVAPDLVLGEALHRRAARPECMTRVVFADMLKAGASVDVERYVTTNDPGIETAGNDLVLIKLKRPAPAGWRVAELPLVCCPRRPSLRRRRGARRSFPTASASPPSRRTATASRAARARSTSQSTRRAASDRRRRAQRGAAVRARVSDDARQQEGGHVRGRLGRSGARRAADPLGRGARQLLLVHGGDVDAVRTTRRSSSTRTPSARFCSGRRSWARRCGRRSAGATTST